MKQIDNAMKKTNVLQGLKNIKIVLGNGFDLSVGMKTSYKDYFAQDNGMKIIKQYLSATTNPNVISFCLMYDSYDNDNLRQLLNKAKTTIWHLYFCCNKAKNN